MKVLQVTRRREAGEDSRRAFGLFRCLALLLLVGGTGGTAVQTARAQEVSAEEIVRRADALTRGETQAGTYRMIIARPDWERTMGFEYWSEGTEKTFIRVKEPVKERGVGFLKIKREMWQYVPRINRVIKIPPSMMLQSWMGSDFTNDDLVKESSIVDDYEHRLVGREAVEGSEAYKVELTPKPQTPVAWDRLFFWVRVEDFVPLRAEYFNERGERVRTMLYMDVKAMGGRTLPTRFEILEEKEPGRKTVLVLEAVTFNKPIDPSIFTEQNLRRAR